MIRYLAVVVLFAASAARASFDFGPIISTLQPAGAGATASYTVTNTGENKIPVQVTIVAREPDPDGKEVYKETDAVSDMFRIFPGQIVLNPKETRTLRVSYIGTPKIKGEMAFRIIAEELPVDMSDPNKVYKKAVAKVTLATKYIGSLYVSPSGAKSEMLVEAQPDDAKKAKNLLLTVTNKGTAHQLVRKPTLKLQSLVDGSEVLLTNADAEKLANLNVLPGKLRKFTLPWPSKIPAGPVKASIDFSKE
jgi:fimbrial chaperone protein